MMIKTLICSAALVLTAGSALAQGACADHEAVVERLASGYGESRQSMGIAADGTVVEVFASLDTGTWTITVTRAGGPTCLVASGYEFQHVEEDLAFLDPEA
ncbi:MAG: hypothetical protein AAGL89_09795 [Pseudomonadota bacterium]